MEDRRFFLSASGNAKKAASVTSALSVTRPASLPTASATFKASPVMTVIAAFICFCGRYGRNGGILDAVHERDKSARNAHRCRHRSSRPVPGDLSLPLPAANPPYRGKSILPRNIPGSAADMQRRTVRLFHDCAVAAQRRMKASSWTRM